MIHTHVPLIESLRIICPLRIYNTQNNENLESRDMYELVAEGGTWAFTPPSCGPLRRKNIRMLWEILIGL